MYVVCLWFFHLFFQSRFSFGLPIWHLRGSESLPSSPGQTCRAHDTVYCWAGLGARSPEVNVCIVYVHIQMHIYIWNSDRAMHLLQYRNIEVCMVWWRSRWRDRATVRWYDNAMTMVQWRWSDATWACISRNRYLTMASLSSPRTIARSTICTCAVWRK